MSFPKVMKAIVSGQARGLTREEITQKVYDQIETERKSNAGVVAQLREAFGPDARLNDDPDGYGYFYGTLRRGDVVHRLNVMPPLPHWTGAARLDEYGPHETDWVVYLNGDEIARASRLALLPQI